MRIEPRDGLGIATVLARKNAIAPLAARVREHFALDLPRGPMLSRAGDVSILGTGPGAWLVVNERDGNRFVAALRESIGDVACVSDQSDGLAVLRLSGPRVRDALCKLVAIDLHPRAFEPGRVAVTLAGHIGATLWRLGDLADGSAAFEIAVPLSYSTSFWQALRESAAEFMGESSG
jgi:sarcosine oxidase subunit gamma